MKEKSWHQPVEHNVRVVDAHLAERIPHPFGGHDCKHQGDDVAHAARQLEHYHHQRDWGKGTQFKRSQGNRVNFSNMITTSDTGTQFKLTNFFPPFQHLLSERLTSLGIMGAPRVPPLNPSESIVF